MSASYDEIADILAESLGQSREELDPAATFDDLGLESIALLELSVLVEERQGVQLEGIDARSTLGEAAAALDAARSAADTAPAAVAEPAP